MASFFTDDCIYEDLAVGTVNRGKEGVKGWARFTFAAFPDYKIELTSCFVSGNWVGSEWLMSGTHRGDLPELRATGRAFSLRGVSIAEFEGTKIRRNTDYWNMVTLLQQLGAMPQGSKG
jgi:steroid delta-isomerase-like uncharacterized protein